MLHVESFIRILQGCADAFVEVDLVPRRAPLLPLSLFIHPRDAFLCRGGSEDTVKWIEVLAGANIKLIGNKPTSTFSDFNALLLQPLEHVLLSPGVALSVGPLLDIDLAPRALDRRSELGALMSALREGLQ
eukprot:CAMPEP_0170486388 /NCGR_PEP_ID=MMETSP0208-20121228/5429_1 /TAXON_ID=197538 /ORGANISM="Strombidium inclinatum, Strain S3" /LENGTH=130 /DNA_ID=CAMNT_0010760323 /DNA_START=651 /DNA_END=1043 /DNA_ORIENTATION=-